MKHPILRSIALSTAVMASLLAPSPAQAQETNPLPCAKWHSALREHGLPVRVFAPIMWRESKCKPKAIGWNYHKGKSHLDCRLSHARTYRKCPAVRSYDVGLLQINSSWKTLTARVCNSKFGEMLVLQNPDCNLKVAAVLYNGGKGLSNWQGTSSRMSSQR